MLEAALPRRVRGQQCRVRPGRRRATTLSGTITDASGRAARRRRCREEQRDGGRIPGGQRHQGGVRRRGPGARNLHRDRLADGIQDLPHARRSDPRRDAGQHEGHAGSRQRRGDGGRRPPPATCCRRRARRCRRRCRPSSCSSCRSARIPRSTTSFRCPA